MTKIAQRACIMEEGRGEGEEQEKAIMRLPSPSCSATCQHSVIQFHLFIHSLTPSTTGFVHIQPFPKIRRGGEAREVMKVDL